MFRIHLTKGNEMKYLLTVLVLLIPALFMSSVFASQETYEYPAMLTVTGYGMAGAEPDIATVVFGVDLVRDNPGIAVEEAAGIINNAMGAARNAGVDGEDMHTTGYNLWVQEVYDNYTYEYTGEFEYCVNHYISVDIRDIDSVGEVLIAIVNAGANSITSVTYRVEDTSGLYTDARLNAVQNACEKAQELANGFDVTLGEVQNISEWLSYYPSYDAGYYNYGGGQDAYCEVPPVTPGSYSVSLELSVTFELIRND